jgi:NagD protein
MRFTEVATMSKSYFIDMDGVIVRGNELIPGVHPYFIGKPNPLMMRSALRFLGEHSEDAMMVGDRMDTDIRAGTEAGMETVLVLTGVTTREVVDRFPYQPTRIVNSVAELELDQSQKAEG